MSRNGDCPEVQVEVCLRLITDGELDAIAKGRSIQTADEELMGFEDMPGGNGRYRVYRSNKGKSPSRRAGYHHTRFWTLGQETA